MQSEEHRPLTLVDVVDTRPIDHREVALEREQLSSLFTHPGLVAIASLQDRDRPPLPSGDIMAMSVPIPTPFPRVTASSDA